MLLIKIWEGLSTLSISNILDISDYSKLKHQGVYSKNFLRLISVKKCFEIRYSPNILYLEYFLRKF